VHREYTILVDEREKRPLPFPSHLVLWDPSSLPTSPRAVSVRLLTRSARLLSADYCLDEPSPLLLVERKGSYRELAGNLCTP
jgi:hypothetical protein